MGVLKFLFTRRILTNLSYTRYYYIRRFCNTINDHTNVDDVIEYVFPIEKIRNFSIIAHVDHGKSTLADRLLEHTGAIKPGTEKAQILDQLPVERQRGITVKAVTASLCYNYKNENYLLNLIDTPGHVDFSNEVVKSVQSCQGAILLVDAADGPQAQTFAVFNLAKQRNLAIIPVLNKIDLPRANPSATKEKLKALFDINPDNVLEISAKKGWGIENLLNALVEQIPSPNVSRNGSLKAVVFDTWYDKYRGVLCLAYVEKGIINKGDSVRWLSSVKQHYVKHLSLLTPEEKHISRAEAGQVIVVGCGPKTGGAVGDILISYNLTENETKTVEFSPIQHMVFAGIYPEDQAKHQIVRNAIEKLSLNDSAACVNIDNSVALGQGWRIGFLGVLHMEVFIQRLLQEYKAEAIITAPSVPFRIKLKGRKIIKLYKSEIIQISNPAKLPDEAHIEEYYEPFVIGNILTPLKYYGPIIAMCLEKRGISLKTTPIDDENIMFQFRLPLCEVIMNFHDELKSLTSGYANFDYIDDGFHPSNLVKIEIRLNGEVMEELTSVIHVSKIQKEGRRLVEKVKENIPRQLIHIAIQAFANGRVIARENLQAYKKNVTAKLYGGDVTRKQKLLKQQAEGKKKLLSKATMCISRTSLIDILKK